MNSDALGKELITLDIDLVGIGMVQSQCSLTWEEGEKSGTGNTCLTAYHMFSQSFHDTNSVSVSEINTQTLCCSFNADLHQAVSEHDKVCLVKAKQTDILSTL